MRERGLWVLKRGLSFFTPGRMVSRMRSIAVALAWSPEHDGDDSSGDGKHKTALDRGEIDVDGISRCMALWIVFLEIGRTVVVSLIRQEAS